MKKTLIIGVSGFVGGYLAEELKRNNMLVFGADKKKCSIDDNISFRKIDLLDKESIVKIFNEVKPDFIINLAAISSVKLSWDIPDVTFDVNVKGVINLFEAINKTNLKSRVLLVGSSEQYGRIKIDDKIDENHPLNAINPYGISKITQEKLALMYKDIYGIDVILVRAFNHTGPKQGLGFVVPDFAKQIAEIKILDKEPIMYIGNLKAERDIADVRDIVKGYCALLLQGKSGEIYNIGSGKAYKIEHLLNKLIEYSGKNIKINIDPNKFRPLDTQRIVCSNEKITRATGWKPEISMDETLRDTYEYWTDWCINIRGSDIK